MAGILDRQAEELIAAYSRWYDLQVALARDGWVCLAGTRKP